MLQILYNQLLFKLIYKENDEKEGKLKVNNNTEFRAGIVHV